MTTTVRRAFTLRWSAAKCTAAAAWGRTASRRATAIGSGKTRCRILVQFGLSKHADLPHVPSLMELAKTPQDRQLAELMLAPLEMAARSLRRRRAGGPRPDIATCV